MANKNTLKSYPIIVAGSAAGNLISAITSIQYLDNVGVQINLTSAGSMTGVFSVQVSADYNTPPNNPGNWITLTTAAVTSGSPALIYFDLNQLSSPYVQLIYTAGSGSGTVNAFITAKAVG